MVEAAADPPVAYSTRVQHGQADELLQREARVEALYRRWAELVTQFNDWLQDTLCAPRARVLSVARASHQSTAFSSPSAGRCWRAELDTT